jgi:hypothetical protein
MFENSYYILIYTKPTQSEKVHTKNPEKNSTAPHNRKSPKKPRKKTQRHPTIGKAQKKPRKKLNGTPTIGKKSKKYSTPIALKILGFL